jgi:sugar phosphate isomerase/epimerase
MPDRRQFLINASVLALGAGMVRNLPTFPEAPHINFPTAPRARLAVASWPFRAFIDSPSNHYRDPSKPGMDLTAFPAMVVREFGLHNIEPLSAHFRSTAPDYLHQLRSASAKAGVRVVDIAVGAQGSFYDRDSAKRNGAVSFAKHWIDIAVGVGSPSVRVHIGGVRGIEPDVARAAGSLARVAEYGASRNVVVNLENDDLVSEDAFFIVKVIDRVGSPWLHALPDFANSALTGEPAFNYDALAVMFRHAYNISHMKDSETGPGGKLYTVDVASIFRIARANGYRGYFSMEWDTVGDPYQGTHRLIEETLKNLA